MTGFYYPPKTIPEGDGRDVAGDLTDWIAGLPDGTGPTDTNVAVFAGRTYRCDSTVYVLDKTWFGLAGMDAHFVRVAEPAGLDAGHTRILSHFRFERCEHFWFNRVHVTGIAPETTGYQAKREAQHAFELQSCRYGSSKGCTVDGVWGDGFNFRSDLSSVPSAHHTVSNFSSGVVHRQGVSVTDGDDLAFSDCRFGRAWRSAVDLEPNTNTGQATNITFEDCSFGSHRLGWVTAMPRCGIVTDVAMTRCTDGSPLMFAVSCDPTYTADGITPRRANFAVAGCTSTAQQGGPSGAVMDFHYTDGTVTIINNVNPLQKNRTPPMRMARFDEYTTANTVITYEGNTPDLGVTPDVAVGFILLIVLALMAVTTAVVVLIVVYERSRRREYPDTGPYDWTVTDTPTEPEPEPEEEAEPEGETET